MLQRYRFYCSKPMTMH